LPARHLVDVAVLLLHLFEVWAAQVGVRYRDADDVAPGIGGEDAAGMDVVLNVLYGGCRTAFLLA
jgi:hypothetical protein